MRLKEKELTSALSFATDVYRVHKAVDKLTIAAGQSAEQLVAALGRLKTTAALP